MLHRLWLAAMITVLFGAGCENSDGGKKGEGDSRPGQKINNGGPGQLDPSQYDLCGALNSNSNLMSLAGKDVAIFCQNLLQLRQAESVYAGEANAKVITYEAKEIPGANSLSRVVLISSLKQSNLPLYFYNKVKLEVTDPLEFKQKGFEMTPDEDFIDHEVLEKQDISTKFKYTNRSDPDVEVAYIGRSTFFTITPDQTYVVVSKSLESIKTAKEFDGLITINRTSTNPPEIEVFALTTEAYENFGNHNQLVEKLKIKFGKEQTRGYRNGLKAQTIKLSN